MSFLSDGKKWFAVIALLLVVGATLSQFYGVRVVASLRGQEGYRCPIESPIQISVRNFTFSRIARLTVGLEGWRDSRSDNILDGRRYAFNVVVEPFRSRVACYHDKAFAVPEYKDKLSSTGRYLVDTAAVIDQVNQYRRLVEGVELVVLDYQPTFLDD